MIPATALTVLEIMLSAMDKAVKAGSLLRQCQAEGRTPTPEEVQVFFEEDDAARARLQSAIDAAKSGG
jgi:hypothetical protein